MHRFIMSIKLISIGETARLLGVSIDTLRRWDKAGRLLSIRSGVRGHRYYRREDIDLYLRDEVTMARAWVEGENVVEPESQVYCQTRDDFQARLENLQSVLSRSVRDEKVSLLTAIAGEIGNNSFDHNIGNWPDIPGIFFSYSLRNRIVVLADRGQGVLTTLKRVKPGLTSPSEALEVAFTQTISGRAPEARGNGLKFVRDVIIHGSLRLEFQTGDAVLNIAQDKPEVVVKQVEKTIRGCFAKILFERLL